MSKFSQVICFSLCCISSYLLACVTGAKREGRVGGRKARMIKQLLNPEVIAKYRDLSVSRRSLSPLPPSLFPFFPMSATQATISPLYTLKRVKFDQHGPETLTFLTTFTSCTVFQIQPVLMPKL